MTHGVYAARDVLLATPEFKGRGFVLGSPGHLPQASVPIAGSPIPPGWSRRLHVTGDGRNYDALLEDTTDTSCSYAAVTDERNVIRQSRGIDCAI